MQELAEIIVRPLADELTRASIAWTDQWLAEEAMRAIPKEDGKAVARYGRRAFIVCWASIVVFGAACILTLVAAPGYAKWFATPFALFLIAGVLGLLDAKYLRYEFNREELFVRTFWRGRRLIPWSAVESLGYSLLGCRMIYAGDYGKVVISNYLPGSQALIDLVRARLLERGAKMNCILGHVNINSLVRREVERGSSEGM